MALIESEFLERQGGDDLCGAGWAPVGPRLPTSLELECSKCHDKSSR
jgi:hypothetical protein